MKRPPRATLETELHIIRALFPVHDAQTVQAAIFEHTGKFRHTETIKEVYWILQRKSAGYLSRAFMPKTTKGTKQ